jgi:DNA polymerase-4
MFGKSGIYFYNMAHKIDTREVHVYHGRRSIGSERTLHEDADDVEEIIEHLEYIAERLTSRMKKYNIKGRTITMKVKYHNFRRTSRSLTVMEVVDDPEVIMSIVKNMIPKTDVGKKKVRLVGISISHLSSQSELKYEQQILPDFF